MMYYVTRCIFKQEANMKNKKLIPIFFSTDDRYAPYLATALESLKTNSSEKFTYDINILIENLSPKHTSLIQDMQTENIRITFHNVSERLSYLCSRLHLRDYYTKATYYRFFIPEMFPQYDKGLYLDCDIAITRDVADMFNTPIGNNLVGAVTEEVMTDIDVFGRYSEIVLGIPRKKYFNAGILVMNLSLMRRIHIEEVFASLLSIKTYSVAQDQDYLNVICYGRVKYLNPFWNKTPMPYSDPNTTPYIAHYKINFKPWKYDGIVYGDLFWKYAQNTPYYHELLIAKNNYTEKEKTRDAAQYTALEALAQKETDEELQYFSTCNGIYISGINSIAEDYMRGNKFVLAAEAD